MCLVYGFENDFGLRTAYYELNNGDLLGIFKPLQEHQSYPGRLHGGIATALLDETIGRAILIHDRDQWGVTLEVTTRFRKPVPLEDELRVIGRIDKVANRYFEGTGKILLQNGTVAVEAKGRYLKMPREQISGFNLEDLGWEVIRSADYPEEVEI